MNNSVILKCCNWLRAGFGPLLFRKASPRLPLYFLIFVVAAWIFVNFAFSVSAFVTTLILTWALRIRVLLLIPQKMIKGVYSLLQKRCPLPPYPLWYFGGVIGPWKDKAMLCGNCPRLWSYSVTPTWSKKVFPLLASLLVQYKIHFWGLFTEFWISMITLK